MKTDPFEVVRIVREHRAANGYAPTQREIAAQMRITQHDVAKHVRWLCAFGYLTKTPYQWRSLDVVRIGDKTA